MEIKLKLDESGSPVLDDNGHPVYIFTDKSGAKEEGVDVAGLFSKVTGLNNESADRRHKLNEANQIIKVLEEGGIDLKNVSEFVNSSKENAQKIADFNEKDMKSIKEVEDIKKGVSSSFEIKINEMAKVIDTLKSSSEKALSTKEQVIRNLMVKGSFSKSDFIKDKTVLTPDIAYNTFGRNFQVEENGETDPLMYAIDHNGEKIFSKTRPGEYADPEEAIEILIKSYHQADSILRPSQGGETGAGPAKIVKKGQFSYEQLQDMSPTERLKVAHKMNK